MPIGTAFWYRTATCWRVDGISAGQTLERLASIGEPFE
jgi:hypothetical protein